MHEKLPDRTKWLTPAETPRQEMENALAHGEQRLREMSRSLAEQLDDLTDRAKEGHFEEIEDAWPDILQETIKCKLLDKEVHDLNRALKSELEQ